MEELNSKQEDHVLEQAKEETPKTNTLIDDANLAAKRMEDANKIKKELLDREEELMVKQRMGGNTIAGETKKIVEETPVEYKNRIEREGI